jgi:homoserine kinase
VDHRVASRSSSVKLLVPASSANLGPGFDALGMALDIHAEIGLVDATTPDADLAKRVDEKHPAQVAFAAAGGTGTLWVRSPIPIGRGLGFSGAMRVGGAALGVVQRRGPEALTDRRTDNLGVASGLEGHADNVAASLFGGIVATAGAMAVRIETPLRPDVVLWIPEETTSTSDSRTALPVGVPFDDAVFNVGRTALLVAAIAAGDAAALAAATQDRLHQDRRLAAAGMSRAALEAGMSAGAWCGWLSGSGPAVAFLAEGGDGKSVAAALPPSGHSRLTAIDLTGTRLID